MPLQRCLCLTLSLSLIGCSSFSNRAVSPAKTQVVCHQAELFALSNQALAPDLTKAPVKGLNLSRQSITTADIIGATPLLKEWALVSSGTTNETRRLVLRQKIVEKIVLANLEIATALAYIDCEGEHTDQLRDRLQRHETKRIEQLTLASIIVGAGTVVTAGALALGGAATAGNIVAISGGSAEAGLSVYAFRNRDIGENPQQNNILKEVWRGPGGQSYFPPVIWRYLNSPIAQGEPTTIREALKTEWRSDELLGKPGSDVEQHRTALFFGSGGEYSLDDLRAKEGMQDLLEARVAMFNQRLAKLLREFLSATY